MGDDVDKNANFVDMFNKEQYKYPFLVMLHDKDEALVNSLKVEQILTVFGHA